MESRGDLGEHLAEARHLPHRPRETQAQSESYRSHQNGLGQWLQREGAQRHGDAHQDRAIDVGSRAMFERMIRAIEKGKLRPVIDRTLSAAAKPGAPFQIRATPFFKAWVKLRKTS